MTTRGFDLLGYWFSGDGLGIAWKSVGRMEAKVARLYEQQGADFVRIEVYLCHWLRWVRSGLGEVVGRLGLPVVSLVVGRGGLEAVRRVTPYAR